MTFRVWWGKGQEQVKLSWWFEHNHLETISHICYQLYYLRYFQPQPQTAFLIKLLLVLSAFTSVYVKWVSYLVLSQVTKEVSVLFNVMLNSWSEEQNVWKWSLIVFSFLPLWLEDMIIAPSWQGRALLKEREAWRCFLEMSLSRECCGFSYWWKYP